MNKKQLRKKLALMLANLKKKRKYYTEVEYLESDSTAYIDTGVSGGNDNLKIEMGFSYSKFYSYGYFFANYESEQHNTTRFVLDSTNNSIGLAYINTRSSGGAIYPRNITMNDKHSLVLTKTTCSIDGVIATNPNPPVGAANTKNIVLFNRGSGSYASTRDIGMRCYYFRIYDNNTLICDMIPVLDWNMKPCMYDKVSGELFYNKGTGDNFLYGRQIHPVEYLESTGTQYINTGIIGTNANMGIDVDWAFSKNDANMCIFSSRSGQTSNTFTLFWLKTASNRMRFDGRGQVYFTDGVNASVSDDIFNFNYKSKTDAVATLTNKTTGQVQTYTIGKLETFSTKPLYLFCSRDTAYVYSWIKMYGCKIYDGDALIRDYIPAVDENGVGFMFDRVSHTIYDNAGTGAFGYNPVKLEYLESTGTQYIDTGIQPTDDYGYKIRNTYTRGAGEQCAIGGMDSGNRFVGVYTSGSQNQLSGAWGSFVNFLPSYPWDTGDILDVEVNYKNSRKMIVNGTELKDISDIHISGTISNTLYLFARHYDNNITKMNGKVYGVEITNGQDVVADFIPVFYNGQSGMLDKVNEVFYPNKGTGSFVGGAIVEPEYD